jgi:hypothetical protein
MIFMACGFDGAEKFVQGSSKSSISEDSLLRPEISHWSPLVEKWLPETTEVQITWKNIFFLNAGSSIQWKSNYSSGQNSAPVNQSINRQINKRSSLANRVEF